VAVGEMPCPGEAHSNAFIDHCALCAPRWGITTKYAPINVEAACSEGKAVMVADVEGDAFDLAKKSTAVQLIGATEKRKGATSHFYVFVAR
jgi:hypothetical protein